MMLRRASSAIFIAALLSCAGEEVETPAHVLAFEVVPPAVNRGEVVSIHWEVADADRVLVIASPGGVLVDRNDQEGTIDSPPLDETTRFLLRIIGGGGQDERSVGIAVRPRPRSVRIVEFVVTPETIVMGDSARVAYEVENAERVVISSSGGETVLESSEAMTSTSVAPTSTTSYVLTAEGFGGPVTATRTLAVIQ